MLLNKNLANIFVITILLSINFIYGDPIFDQNEKNLEYTKSDELPDGEETDKPNFLDGISKMLFGRKNGDAEYDSKPSFTPMFGRPFSTRRKSCCKDRIVIVKPVPIPILLSLLIRNESEDKVEEDDKNKLPVAPDVQLKPVYSDVTESKTNEYQQKNTIDQQKDQPIFDEDQNQNESTKEDDDKKISKVVYSDKDTYDLQPNDDKTKNYETKSSNNNNDYADNDDIKNEINNIQNNNDDDAAKYENNDLNNNDKDDDDDDNDDDDKNNKDVADDDNDDQKY